MFTKLPDMNILIISGGNSSERKISFLSAREVKTALEANKYKVKIFDLKKGAQEMIKLIKNCDVVFPVIHGEEGEGGELQRFLTKIGKPYVGGSAKGYKEGWFKIPFKKFCNKGKIVTAPWKIVKGESDIINFGFPCVLKTSNGGSSKEVIMLHSIEHLKRKPTQKLLASQNPLMVEKYLKGTEVTVGILNNKALPIMEIVPPEGEWFDFKNKYSGKAVEIPHAPSLDEQTKKLLQDISLKIHKSLNLGHYSRIDFIVTNSCYHLGGGKLIPHALEVNTIPGLTSQSLFPKAAKAAGITFNELIQKMVTMSL